MFDKQYEKLPIVYNPSFFLTADESFTLARLFIFS